MGSRHFSEENRWHGHVIGGDEREPVRDITERRD